MKFKLVYSVMMEDSPSIYIVGLFTSDREALKEYNKSKKNDYDDESNENGNWCRTEMLDVEICGEHQYGTDVYIPFSIDWLECIEEKVMGLFLNEAEAQDVLYNEYCAIKETMGRFSDDDRYSDYFHIADDSVMEDVYGIILKTEIR